MVGVPYVALYLPSGDARLHVSPVILPEHIEPLASPDLLTPR